MQYVAVSLRYLFGGSSIFSYVNCGLLDFVQAEKKDTVGAQEQVTAYGLIFFCYGGHFAGFCACDFCYHSKPW